MPALFNIGKRGGGAVLLFVCLLSGSQSARAQSEAPVKIRAEASVRGSTLADRDEAVRKAKQQAIRLWLNSLLGSPPTSAFDAMLEHPDYYVQTFRILDLDVRAGDTYVDIEAYLHPWALKADAATVLFEQRHEPPRLALLFVEERIDQGSRRFQSATRVAEPVLEVLTDRGFPTVPPDDLRRRYSERELLGLINAGTEALARCAREQRAEALVLVTSTLDVKPNRGGVGPLRARVALDVSVVGAAPARLYERADAAAEVNCLTADEGLAFALGDAVYKVRDRLLVGVALAGAGPESSAAFELTLEEAPSWQAVEGVADRLRAHPGVGNLEVLTAQRGFGLIRFHYDGSIGELVRVLEEPVAQEFALEARAVIERQMRFRFVDR